jgi:hypothetical protein
MRRVCTPLPPCRLYGFLYSRQPGRSSPCSKYDSGLTTNPLTNHTKRDQRITPLAPSWFLRNQQVVGSIPTAGDLLP